MRLSDSPWVLAPSSPESECAGPGNASAQRAWHLSWTEEEAHPPRAVECLDGLQRQSSNSSLKDFSKEADSQVPGGGHGGLPGGGRRELPGGGP